MSRNQTKVASKSSLLSPGMNNASWVVLRMGQIQSCPTNITSFRFQGNLSDFLRSNLPLDHCFISHWQTEPQELNLNPYFCRNYFSVFYLSRVSFKYATTLKLSILMLWETAKSSLLFTCSKLKILELCGVSYQTFFELGGS